MAPNQEFRVYRVSWLASVLLVAFLLNAWAQADVVSPADYAFLNQVQPSSNADDFAMISPRDNTFHSTPASALPLPSGSDDKVAAQKLVDSLVFTIVTQSKIGRSIVRDVLSCDQRQIFQHLGVSFAMSKRLKALCPKLPKELPPAEVLAIKNAKIKKSSSARHSFIFVVTQLKRFWPYDSWTNPHSNKTFIIIRNYQGADEVNSFHLLQKMAHEMAIYFDSKYLDAVLTEELEKSSSVRNTFLNPPWLNSKTPDHRLKASLNNPILAMSLGYIRAFKAEKSIIEDIFNRSSDKKIRGWLKSNYKKQALFATNCEKTCLQLILEHQANLRHSEVLPSLALHPLYGQAKYRSLFIEDRSQITLERAKSHLIDIPYEFRNRFWNANASDRDGFMAMVNPHQFLGHFTSYLDVYVSFKSDWWKEDYNYLKNYYVTQSPDKISLLEFLAEPRLSNVSIQFSTGPRPRVIGGGIRR